MDINSDMIYIDSLVQSYPLMSYFIAIILGLLLIAKFIKNDNDALEAKPFYFICFIICLIPTINIFIGIISIFVFLISYIIKALSFLYNNLDEIYQIIVISLNKNLDKSKIKLSNENKFKLLKKILIENKYFENNDEIEAAINSYMVANLLIGKKDK